MIRALCCLLLAGLALACAAAPPKTLRYAFPVAETSFDPAQISDLYSRTVAAGIFDAPLEFAFMARPFQLRPNTAVAMPEVSADFRSFTIRIQPGIHFDDDSAFGGRKRELTAADYVYSIKRHYDPRWKSGNLYILEGAKILGLSELRKQAVDGNKPFDYDTEAEGLRALDRYTFRILLAEPSPRFLYNLADGSFTGALAREVVDAYGDKVGEHPVGTGPFRLAQWKRSSRMLLQKNPNYREVLYDEQPPADDARLQAIAARFKGRRLPMIDEVQISVIEEAQPRWLSFLNGEQDLLEGVPGEFANIAIPNNQLAPNLAKRGIGMLRVPRADVAVTYFGMDNPVVGGTAPDKVALRRAISLAVDVEREILLVRRGQAVPAQSPIAPGTWGYDPAFRSEMGEHSLARAKALLQHKDFSLRNPNRVRSLLVALCRDNPAAFHRADASGYVFWAERLIELDAINPSVAGRLARVMDRWSHLAEPYRSAAREAIARVAARNELSTEVREIINRALESA